MGTKPEFKVSMVPNLHANEKMWERDGSICLLLSSVIESSRRLSGQVCYDNELWTQDAKDRYARLVKGALYGNRIVETNAAHIKLVFNDTLVPLRPWVNHSGWMTNEIDRLARLISWARKMNEPMIDRPPTTTLKKAEFQSGEARSSDTCRLITPVGLALTAQAAGFFEGRVSETYAEFFAINFAKTILIPYWREEKQYYGMIIDKTIEELAEYSGEQIVYLEKIALEFDKVPLSS